MKGIILHGGHGTRLRPLTHTGPKQLLPIANKPMSQYAFEALRETGIKDIAVIIGDVYPEKVQDFYGDGSKFEIKLTYIFQDKPKGISHAIRLCKDFVGNDKFVVYLGDNILRKGLTDYRKKFESSNADAMILLCEVADPSRFGIAEFENGIIKKIIEKPKATKSNLAVIGVYFLTPRIFDIIDTLKPSWREELEITDALQSIINSNSFLDHDVVTGWWKDTGTPEDILHANKLVLDTLGSPDQLVEKQSQLDENILIGKNSLISKDSFVKGPVIIGNNCTIGPSCRIGPYVSIGNNSILKNCDVENSIIMNECKILSKSHIFNSIIAHGSEINDNKLPKKQQFLLGERSQINL